jgi:tetratricopeptide (TPR) repeat protein
MLGEKDEHAVLFPSGCVDLGDLIWALLAVAKITECSGCYERTLEAAQEALSLCHNDKRLSCVDGPVKNGDTDAAVCLRRSLQMASLGKANLGKITQGLLYANQAVESVTKLNSVWFPSTYSIELYIDARGQLAKVLLAAGETEAARHVFEERREYFLKRVTEKNGEYRDLAPTLRILGIVYCSKGNHEKGSAIAQELHETLDRLKGIFMSLHNQVMSRLTYELMAPISQAARDLLESLDCDHQAGFTHDSENDLEA